MSSFTGDLTVTQLSGKPGAWRLWRLEQALIYERDGRYVMVDAGFITDGPSIPRIFWAVLPVWASWSRAGVVHDYLCCLIAMGRPHREAPTRRDADGIFHEAMVACGTGILPRTLLYIGVRIGTIFGVKTTMIGVNEKFKASMDAAAY